MRIVCDCCILVGLPFMAMPFIRIWQKELERQSIFIVVLKCKLSCILFDHSANRFPYRWNRTFALFSRSNRRDFCVTPQITKIKSRIRTNETIKHQWNRVKSSTILKRIKCYPNKTNSTHARKMWSMRVCVGFDLHSIHSHFLMESKTLSIKSKQPFRWYNRQNAFVYLRSFARSIDLHKFMPFRVRKEERDSEENEKKIKSRKRPIYLLSNGVLNVR